MNQPTPYAFTTQVKWFAIVARHFDLDVERMNRRLYQRRHKRYDLEFGQARVEFDAAPGDAKPRRPDHLTVLQISPDGLMLRGYDDIEGGTPITVTVNVGEDTAVLRGVVRHSTQTLGGFKLGVEISFDHVTAAAQSAG